MSSIPQSHFSQVLPGVVSAGGNAVTLNGLFLTTNTRVPIGTVLSLAPTVVTDYFGPTSAEAAEAAVYGLGFTGCTQYPGAMLFAQYPIVPVAAWLRGGSVASLGLAGLQALPTGSLNVVVDGYTHAISSISLSTYSSQSAMATAIGAAFTDPTEASFTASIGAVVTASVGSHSATCTTTGTTLTLGSLTDGYLSAGDLVSGTDGSHSLASGCYIVKQLTGTLGGGAGATFQLSAAGVGGDLSSFTCTATSTVLDATVVTGLISVGDIVTTISTSAVVATQLTGTTSSTGTYQLSGITAQGIASGSMTLTSTVLDVTVCASPTIAVGQTVVGSGVTGSPLITAMLGSAVGGIGQYQLSSATQHVVSESMTGIATAPVVTYDSVSSAFVITSGITGTPSTMAYATGTLAPYLNLTLTTGALISQGAAPASPATFMNTLIQTNQNWGGFKTMFDPDGGSGNTVKQAFAAWKNTQNNKYLYAAWDTDQSPVVSAPAASSLGAILAANGDSGTCLISEPSNLHLATFVLSYCASLNFAQKNGRFMAAYRSQPGLTASVDTLLAAENLESNGYSYYGAEGGRNPADNATFFYPGFVTGPFKWLDSYANQMWLNASLQQANLTFLLNTPSIPYNNAGYALAEAAIMDTVNAALNYGAIQKGVTLSSSQIAAVNNAAGKAIDQTLSTRGWYLSIQPASPTTRVARTSPVIIFFYTDGGSWQSINLSSLMVQ